MTSEPESDARVGALAVPAVLVGVQLPEVSDEELAASLDELERLAETLGLRAIARLTQRRKGTGTGSVLGAGKLKELARWTGGPGVVPTSASRRQKGTKPAELDEEEPEAEADPEEPAGDPDQTERAAAVLVDHGLTPSQLRNLEGATSAQVLDRPSVILNIFQRHARTREARLQVEIARLSYLSPRLRAAGVKADRQRGGIGGKGAGESALELDRRRVRDRIAELKERLAIVEVEARTQRERRSLGSSITIALVGYTNSGKSSLMRALTGAEVLVADKLFATLDTTVRVLLPETRPRILVSDTVGFIKKLPHDLVASFRSTLEEAREAALLLHVVDASDPAWRSQLELTRTVLADLGAGDRPFIVLLNKCDRLDAGARAALSVENPDAILLSAFDPADVAALHSRIVAFFERDMVEAELFVSYRASRRVHQIYEACRVLEEVYEEGGTRLRVRALPVVVDELRGAVGEEGP
jgi:GTPase